MMDEELIRASLIAHAIRLGKCPAVGVVMGATFTLKDISEEDLAAGRIDQARDLSAPMDIEFAVTAEDLAAGRKLINEQRARYREPKRTFVPL